MKTVRLSYLGQDGNFHDLQIEESSLRSLASILQAIVLDPPQVDGSYSLELEVQNGQVTCRWLENIVTE